MPHVLDENMSLNWVMLTRDGGFVPLPGEQLMYTSPARTSLDVDSAAGLPGKLANNLKCNHGHVHLTNRRARQLIYLPDAPTSSFSSLASPLENVYDGRIVVPYLGPNAFTSVLRTATGGGLPREQRYLQVKLTFNEGGAYDFHQTFVRLRERVGDAIHDARANGEITGDGPHASLHLNGVHLDDLPAYETGSTTSSLPPEQTRSRMTASSTVPRGPPPAYDESMTDTVTS
ncbi:MAG: hypothetical protein M1838_004725 [Thelocarpon superellum]|nr:MAG: hypothetical protein M1838_004725 [Thelocarpon superellum]